MIESGDDGLTRKVRKIPKTVSLIGMDWSVGRCFFVKLSIQDWVIHCLECLATSGSGIALKCGEEEDADLRWSASLFPGIPE